MGVLASHFSYNFLSFSSMSYCVMFPSCWKRKFRISLMVTWARPTFLSMIPFRYMSSMPSWMNFLPALVRFLYSVHWQSALLNCHSIADLGSCAVGWNDGGSTGEVGIGKGWSVDGCGSGIFFCSENCSQVPVVATSKGARYHCEVAFKGLFDILECFIVGSASVFYDFVGKGIKVVVNFVYHGGHVCCV